jgi:GT2 family glycosyltransferase
VAPERSVYNWMCDIEWNVPVGPVRATGGDALFRIEALRAVGGYNPELIAGEEPDMCLRMGRLGWRFERLDAPMTRHDANITRFGQWWRRARRAGYAAAEHVARHGKASLPGDVAQVRRMIAWALVLPLLILLSALLAIRDWRFGLAALVLAALYPAQMLRLARVERPRWPSARSALAAGALRVLNQFAALAGLLDFWFHRLRRRDRGIIEYH